MTENSPTPSSNPLTQANPSSLDELFSRDPLGLADVEIAKIVDKLREKRVEWQKAEAAGAKSAPRPKKAKIQPDTDPVNDLSDLGL